MIDLRIIRMSDIACEPVEWLWEPYIPRGAISMMQGDGGQGKTTLSLAIAAAITKGEALPGKLGDNNMVPANVIVQNGEDSYSRTIKPRLEQFGANCDRVFTIDEEELALSYSDERIEQTIIQMKAKLLIIDPLQAYFGGANMNAANSVRPLMKRLGTIAEQTGCSILLVGHLGKKGGKSQYRGLGSVDIFAAARSVLTVGSIDTDENMRAMVHNKSNLAPPGSSLAFRLDPVSGFYWMGECDIDIDELLSGKKQPKPENQFAKARTFIENTLRNGPVAATDIKQMAKELGISEKTLNRAKSALDVFSIKRNGKWYWELPIDCEYTEVNDDGHNTQDSHNQHGQDPQDGHSTALSILPSLAILPAPESVVS